MANRLTIRRVRLDDGRIMMLLRRGDTENRAYAVRVDREWEYGRLVGMSYRRTGRAKTKDVALARAGKLI